MHAQARTARRLSRRGAAPASCRKLPGGCGGEAAKRRGFRQEAEPAQDTGASSSRSSDGQLRAAVLISGLLRSWTYVRECPFYLVANAAPEGPVLTHYFLAVGVVGNLSSPEAMRVKRSVALLPRNASLSGLRIYNHLGHKESKPRPPKGFPQAWGNLEAWKLLRASERRGGFAYDWVVRTRTDILTRFQLVLSAPPPREERVYTDKLGSCSDKRGGGDEPWKCLKDLFAVLTRGAASAYYEGFHASFDAPASGVLASCPECRLGAALRAKGVRFFLLPRRIPISRLWGAEADAAAPWSHASLDHSSRRHGGLFHLPDDSRTAAGNRTCPSRASSRMGVTCPTNKVVNDGPGD